jgi:hypothetical protein
MNSPSLAIGWEIWRRNRWGFTAILVVILSAIGTEWLASLALSTSPGQLLHHPDLTERRDEIEWLLLAGLFAMLGSLVAVLVMAGYTETEYKTGELGFPSRVFHFPVRTAVLSGWPMLFGATAIVLVFVLWRWLVFAPVGLALPMALPAVSLVTAVLAMQALVWGLPSQPVGRLLALVAIFFGLVLANLCDIGDVRIGGEKFSLIDDFVPSWSPQRIAAFNHGSLMVCAACGIAALVAGGRAVERQRRGRWRGWKSLGRIASGATGRMGQGRAFRSPAAAQFWYEWRRNGWPLPVAVAGLALVLLGPVPWITGVDAQTARKLLAGLVTLPVGLAFVIGLGFGKLDFWAKDFGLSPFLSTWPVSNADLIATKLKVAALAVFMSWGIVLAAVPLWFAIWSDHSTIGKFWQEISGGMSPEARGALMFLISVAAILLTWILMVRQLHFGVLGRPRIFLVGAVGANIFGLALAVGVYVFFFSGYGASFNRLVYFPYLPWLIALALVGKFSAAAWAFTEARRRKILPPQFISVYALLWLLATACFVGAVYLLLPEVTWRRHLAAFAVILLFPLARIGLAPLALSWNRRKRLRSSP